MLAYIRKAVIMCAALFASAVGGQVLKAPYTLLDNTKDGHTKLVALASKTNAAVKKGAVVVTCRDAPPFVYAVKGTSCPAMTRPVEPIDQHQALLNRGDLWGVNISGLEFATELSVVEADIDFYADAGVKSIRLPIKRDRLLTEQKLAALDALVKHATGRGIVVVLDEHSFGNIGDPRIRDFWLRVGPRYKGQHLVWFDLQNEPGGGTWETWGPDSRELIHALRAAGIDNVMVLEWRQSSGASRADKNELSSEPCVSALCSLSRAGVKTLADLDPLKRTVLSPHRYFDKDGSGTSKYCRTDLSPNGAFGSSVSMAQKLGVNLYLGEFAWGSYADDFPESCRTLAPKLIEYLKATPEFIGGASWGWGPRWSKSYIFRGEHPDDPARTWATANGQFVRSLMEAN
jgi:aryl-phospho-beta-D-glucosidase BglC (GH1 family)